MNKIVTVKTYKALSVLLLYPEKEIVDSLDEILDIIKLDNILDIKNIKNITKFAEYIKSKDLITLQEEYVNIFDRQKSLSLHLFEHIHGDSRDRGLAMVDLQEIYAQSNLQIIPGELPDFIPLFLEYLSILTKQEAGDVLSELVNIIAVMNKRLQLQNSLYYYIFMALESLSSAKSDKNIVKKAMADMKKNNLDKEWDESPTFGNQGV